MKIFFLLLSFITVITSPDATCKKQSNTAANCYKGRLEIKGICSNYTIKLVQGNLDANLIEGEWKDEQTGKNHQNVFGLSNPCALPDSLKEGDEFFFTLLPESQKSTCNVCMAFYPTPAKKLNIAVSSTPCK